MNYRTFNYKENLIYRLPAMAIELALHIAVFEYMLAHFRFMDPLDLILARPRSLYFLIVGYLIAAAAFPVRFYERGIRPRTIVFRVFVRNLITLGVFALSVEVLFSSFAGRFFLQDGILATVLIAVCQLAFKALISFARSKGRNKVHVVIVGSDENALRLYRSFTKGREFNDYRFLGFFTDHPENLPENAECLGSVTDAVAYISGSKVHDVYCSLNPATETDRVNAIVRCCEDMFVNFYYVPNMDGYLHRTMTYSEVGHVTVVKLRDEPLSNPVNVAVKRLADILISGLFLVTVFPFVWLFVAIGTKISSPGPVFFRQQRTGYKGRPFTMLKFRSMRVNADADKLQATADDPRKTRFGNFLRKTSLDELPQFINVFLGDMSIIGPRPHMEAHTEMYKKLVDEYLVRHMVKPGLTGWAQVNGCRGETKTTEQMADRVRHDIWYIEHWSLLLDVKIFFMTIFQILGGDEQAY